MEVTTPTMFPDMTLAQMADIRKKCVEEVKKELGEGVVEPIPNLTNEKEETWFEWFSDDDKKWQKYEACSEAKNPAIRYCRKEVCGEFRYPQEFAAKDPFIKCMEKCWEKVKSEEN